MSNKNLAILAAVAAVTVIWAVIQARPPKTASLESEKPVYLIQGLDPADVGSIVLLADGEETTLARQSTGFVITSKDGYPAESEKVNELIAACMDIRTCELVTGNTENHDALGVAEQNPDSAVRFLRGDGSLFTGVIIGKAKEKGDGRYVRRVDDDKVYFTPEAPLVTATPMYYIEQELIRANRFQTASVEVASPGESYTLESLDYAGTEIEMKNMPSGKQFKGKEYERVFSALTSLRFTDVMRQSAATSHLRFDRQFTATLKDSTVYKLGVAQHDGKTYVTCTAEFTDKTPITKEKSVESEDELKKKEEKLLARDKAEAFAAKNKGWIYEIPEYKAEQLTKTLDDLLEYAPAGPNDIGLNKN